jgi:hypothetical protein
MGNIVHLNSLQTVKQFLQLMAKGRPLHVSRRLQEGKKLEQELLFDPEVSNQGFSDRFDLARIFGKDLAQPPFEQVGINVKCIVDIFSSVAECNHYKEGGGQCSRTVLQFFWMCFIKASPRKFLTASVNGICLLFLGLVGHRLSTQLLLICSLGLEMGCFPFLAFRSIVGV